MEQLKSALNTALKREGLDKTVHQNKTLFIWEEVVGKAVAKNCIPEKVQHGILIVQALTPVWRNEIATKKKEIIEKLNTKLGKKIIKDMRVL
mgnify:CR=1 FL=1